jgi:hypothetical protein
MSEPRKFPLPWRIRETVGNAFAVEAADGTTLAYVYFATRRDNADPSRPLSREEAERIANWIAGSPALAQRQGKEEP